MVRAPSAVLFALILVLTGCSAVQGTVGGWFGEEAAPSGASVSGVYFAGSDGLMVHSDASGSSAVVGRLAPYEKVVRSRLRDGYAYVVSEKSGLAGWVDNAQLVWRVSGTGASASKGGAEPAATSPAPAGDPSGTPVETGTGAEVAPSAARAAGADDATAVAPDEATPDEAAPVEAPAGASPSESVPDSEPPAPVPVASPQPKQPTPDIFDPF